MIPAPVCKAALAEATRLWPGRSTASDGICGDGNHAPTSDHKDPDRDGFCEAFDLTHDPARGCDAHALVRAAVARCDPRVKVAISLRQIASSYPVGSVPAWTWRPYTGSNAHDKHAHVSTTDAYRDDTSPWWMVAAPVPPPIPWKWTDHMPKPTEFTSACHDPVSGGWWAQTAEGGVDGHNGATVKESYKDHPELGGNIRYFVAIVPSPTLPGGFCQIANDGALYNWPPKP